MHHTHYLRIHAIVLLLASTLTYGMEPVAHKMSLNFIRNPRNQSITHIEPGEAGLFDHVHQAIKHEIKINTGLKIIHEHDFEEAFLETNYACYRHIGAPSLYDVESNPTLLYSGNTAQTLTDLDTSETDIQALTEQSITEIRREKRVGDVFQQAVQCALADNSFDAIESAGDTIHHLRHTQSLDELGHDGEILLARYERLMDFTARKYLPLVHHAVTFDALKADAFRRTPRGIQKGTSHNNNHRMRTIRARTSLPLKKR